MRRSRVSQQMLSRSPMRLKKSGKPTETPPPYKQVYLPYESIPSDTEIAREHRRFSSAPMWASGYTRMVPVKNVPENMYTYGKEGMSIPIAIFKDQKDPVIAPEHTYPGIYENKIALRYNSTEQYLDKEELNEWKSPFEREDLDARLEQKANTMRLYMGLLKIKSYSRYDRERQSTRPKGAEKAKKDPDTTPAAKTPAAAAPAAKKAKG